MRDGLLFLDLSGGVLAAGDRKGCGRLPLSCATSEYLVSRFRFARSEPPGEFKDVLSVAKTIGIHMSGVLDVDRRVNVDTSLRITNPERPD